jgi:hypothetical protein
MTGSQLIATLRPGQYLKIASGVHRVHRAFIDPGPGEIRICRPSMLDKHDPEGAREWVEATADEFAANPCTVCK